MPITEQPKTAQEIFDIVYRHLLTQNEKCTREWGTSSGCAYEDERGMRCAVGAVMIDDATHDYREARQERCGVTNLVKRYALLCGWMEPFLDLLEDLQYIHDTYQPALWRDHLRAAAYRYNLTVPVL